MYAYIYIYIYIHTYTMTPDRPTGGGRADGGGG